MDEVIVSICRRVILGETGQVEVWRQNGSFDLRNERREAELPEPSIIRLALSLPRPNWRLKGAGSPVNKAIAKVTSLRNGRVPSASTPVPLLPRRPQHELIRPLRMSYRRFTFGDHLAGHSLLMAWSQ